MGKLDYKDRITRLSWFIGILTICFFAGLANRMIFQEKDISASVFIDQKRQAIIYELAIIGVIQPAGKGVAIDKQGLEQAVSSDSLKRFILARQEYMSFKEGNFFIEPRALSVANQRVIRKKNQISRGRIFDRNETVLAYNIKTEKGVVKRVYESGPAFFPVIGVSHSVYGKKGLERDLDTYLRGTVRQGVFTSVFRFFSGKEKNCDAVLTIDKDLQETAFKALEGRSGAVVVLDVETGEILAAASAPSFNPDTPAGIAWDRAEKLKTNGPFVNRVFQKRYPPGSIYKLVVASALLEDKKFDPSWGVDCKGRHPTYNIREHRRKRHGWMSLKNAISLSCNVFFAEAGVKLGPDLLTMSREYGFNRSQNISLEDATGVLPSRAFSGVQQIREGNIWTSKDFKRNPKLVAQGAIGQNVVEATPLQMAQVGATLGNKGVLMKTRLVKHIKLSQRNDPAAGWYNLISFSKKVQHRVVSKDTAGKLLEMMKGVTDKGTGYSLQKVYFKNGRYVKGWNLPKGQGNVFAGKTGTAETGRDTRDHSWFLAVAPVDNPRYSVAVIIENGGYGAAAAGPVAVDVMVTALNMGKK